MHAGYLGRELWNGWTLIDVLVVLVQGGVATYCLWDMAWNRRDQ